MNAPTWTTGVSGSALSFSGSGQYVSATRSAVATNRSFTVAAWVYLTSKGTNHSVVTQDGNSVSDFFLMYDNVIDRFAFALIGSDSTGGSWNAANGTFSPSLSTWYHLVGVYDSSAGNIKLYVNGSLQATTTFTSPWSATGVLAVGRCKWNGSNADDHRDRLRGYLQLLRLHQHVAGGPAAFTAECWFRTASTTGGVILGFGSVQTGDPALFDRILYLDSGNRLSFGTWPSTSTLTVRSTATYNDGAWHHVAGSIGEVAFYNTQLSDQQIAWHNDANH